MVAHRGQSLDDLVAAGAARLERPVERVAVDVEQGEQQIGGADRLGAPAGRTTLRLAHGPVERRLAERGVGGRLVAYLRNRLALERRLADTERLQRAADLAVQPQRAQPALGLVLG